MDYIERYEIPGAGTFGIAKGKFMPDDDPREYSGWQWGCGIGRSRKKADVRAEISIRAKMHLTCRRQELMKELSDVLRALAPAESAAEGDKPHSWIEQFKATPKKGTS